MALTITDRIVRSADTAHTARRCDDGWAVTWLPGRNLTRTQAVAAMEIAEAVGQIAADAGPGAYDRWFWAYVDGSAAPLGLTGPDAVARVSEPPG